MSISMFSSAKPTLHLRIGLLILAAVLITESSDVALPKGKPRPVRVMTRNIYLGADISPVIAAQTIEQLAAAAVVIWNQVQATDAPERAKVLAEEVKKADPVLIGVQEATVFRTGVPDGPPVLGGTPATTVAFDLLTNLLDELAARGVPYNIVRAQPGIDVEAPTTLGFDVRVSVQDVILARADLPADEFILRGTQSANFTNNVSIPILGGLATFTSIRGWAAADVTVNRRSFRFVTTHLESFSNLYRSLQTLELLAGPLDTSMPVVLVGDLNSGPDDPVFQEPGSPFNATNPYDLLTANGFNDTWIQLYPSLPGFTCCNPGDLLNPTPQLIVRVDHVLTRPEVTAYKSKVVGTDPHNRTPSGLWPSDHAGVIASLAP